MSIKQDNTAANRDSTQISLKAVSAFLMILLIGAVVVHASLFWWLDDMNRSPEPDEATQWRTHARFLDQPRPGVPRLQISPAADWQLYATQQQQRLNSYGWINQTTGLVRIPIQEAMERIAKHGPPAWRSTNRTSSPLAIHH